MCSSDGDAVEGVNRACSVVLSAKVIVTTTLVFASYAYLPVPESLLSAVAVIGTTTFDFPVNMVTEPLAPADGVLVPAWSVR